MYSQCSMEMWRNPWPWSMFACEFRWLAHTSQYIIYLCIASVYVCINRQVSTLFRMRSNWNVCVHFAVVLRSQLFRRRTRHNNSTIRPRHREEYTTRYRTSWRRSNPTALSRLWPSRKFVKVIAPFDCARHHSIRPLVHIEWNCEYSLSWRVA